MTTIIDYGMGNLVRKICLAQFESIAQKIILPGVGSFDKAMANLQTLDLVKIIQDRAKAEIPLLGICLGMQLLADGSEEGVLPGLGLIRGKVKQFVLPSGYKVPHMGWNTVDYNRESPLFAEFENFEEARFYFVHSYHFVCDDERHVGGRTDYGSAFTSVVQSEKVYGVQFHPEKSHKFGMQLLRNFIEKRNAENQSHTGAFITEQRIGENRQV